MIQNCVKKTQEFCKLIRNCVEKVHENCAEKAHKLFVNSFEIV